ncbi:MAG TPA: hypothetical protein VEY70_07010 [Metabacillus sp.]|nr:hypothetical protein [Metabacillus sp.]
MSYQFIGEYEGIYTYWVTWGKGEGKMMQFTEEDLKDMDIDDE